MTLRTIVMATAGVVAAALLGCGVYALWFHVPFGERGDTTVHGDDPRILVHDETELPGLPVWGRVAYDGATGCLHVETSTSWATRHTLDQQVGAEWPRGARPVVVDGRRGVRVGGFLGRFGGTVIVEGDLVVGVGSPASQFDEPFAGCDANTPAHTFGDVEQVESLDPEPGSVLVNSFAASCGGVLLVVTNTTAEEPELRWEIDEEETGSTTLRHDTPENVVLIEVGDQHGPEATVRYEVDDAPDLTDQVTGLRHCEPGEQPEWPEDAELFLDDN